MENPFETWAWNYRPLIWFAPVENDARLAEQRAQFADVQDELRDRDLALVELIGDMVRILSGPELAIDARQLHDRLGMAGDRFAVALVGKDTGIKLRSAEPVAAADLFGLIDSMPMRRQEMKQ